MGVEEIFILWGDVLQTTIPPVNRIVKNSARNIKSVGGGGMARNNCFHLNTSNPGIFWEGQTVISYFTESLPQKYVTEHKLSVSYILLDNQFIADIFFNQTKINNI